jgi:hypothetical protein
MAAASRGSEKLWERLSGAGPPKGAHLAEALSAAESEFSIKRWWKYGQPAIDLITAELEVAVESAAKVLGGLVELQGRELQVNFEVFPYGIVAPDALRVNVQLARQVGG